MPQIFLELMLPKKRDQSGVLIVKSAGAVLAKFEALGRGSQGAGDTQMQVNGNTPTGRYAVTQIVPTGGWNQSSYGPNGALRLAPVSGNALAAEVFAGREGLLIHGGAPGKNSYWRGEGELRATHGCVRLSDSDVKRLAELLSSAGMVSTRQQCVPVEVSLTVTDYSMSFARP